MWSGDVIRGVVHHAERCSGHVVVARVRVQWNDGDASREIGRTEWSGFMRPVRGEMFSDRTTLISRWD